MKTNVIRKMVCLFVLTTGVVVMCSARDKKDEMPKVFYDTPGVEALADSQMVCMYDEVGGYYVPKVKYYFTYDEGDRLVEKEAYKWDGVADEWEHSYDMKLAYIDNSIVVDFARWNDSEQLYNEKKEKVVYEMNGDGTMFYSDYKMDERKHDWKLEQHNLLTMPSELIEIDYIVF